MWSEDVRIETPEQIDVALELAGLGSRFLAQVLDWCLKWGLVAVMGLLTFIVIGLLGVAQLGQSLQYLLGALAVVIGYAFFLGFDVFFEVRGNGQTPGKRVAEIRVLREGGAPLDFRTACIRNLLGLADFMPFLYLLGAFMILVTARGQRLGDLAAGTIVIRERKLGEPRNVDQLIESLCAPELAFTPTHLAACSPTDRQVLRSFFQRYQRMDTRPRIDLARRLCEVFLKKTGFQPPQPLRTPTEMDVFLASLYRDLQQWSQL